jgi:hypothetical protein
LRGRQTIGIIVALFVGAAVTFGATRLLAPGDYAARIEDYLVAADQRQLTVRFTMGVGTTITLARLDEHDTDIVVIIRLRDPSGPHTDLGLGYKLTATLQLPVGGRYIVDGSSGESVPLAPY